VLDRFRREKESGLRKTWGEPFKWKRFGKAGDIKEGHEVMQYKSKAHRETGVLGQGGMASDMHQKA